MYPDELDEYLAQYEGEKKPRPRKRKLFLDDENDEQTEPGRSEASE